MAECLMKKTNIPSLMVVAIKGKGLLLNVPFINEVKNFINELRVNNILNRKKVKIEENDKSSQLRRRQELRMTDQKMTEVKE